MRQENLGVTVRVVNGLGKGGTKEAESQMRVDTSELDDKILAETDPIWKRMLVAEKKHYVNNSHRSYDPQIVDGERYLCYFNEWIVINGTELKELSKNGRWRPPFPWWETLCKICGSEKGAIEFLSK